MKNKKKRISYIRKPMPKQSFFCLGFAAVGLVCFGFSLGNSIVKTLKMKEVNYILARAGTIVSGILLFCWLGMLVIGVLSVF